MDEQAASGRRKFLKDLSRWALGLGLAGGIGALVERDPEKCVNRGLCSGCGELSDCRLPQALSAREAMASRK